VTTKGVALEADLYTADRLNEVRIAPATGGDGLRRTSQVSLLIR
jgi:hypothetical protein